MAGCFPGRDSRGQPAHKKRVISSLHAELLLDVPRHFRRFRSDELHRLYSDVAAKNGLLLQYLANDPQTVRLVEKNAGQAIAFYKSKAHEQE